MSNPESDSKPNYRSKSKSSLESSTSFDARMPEKNFLDELIQRDYLHQCTDQKELNKLVSKKKIKAYIGFDCTAKSLHIGNLMQIMILRLLQKHGHKPIILIGSGTTRIGDPTGKDKMRKVLSSDEISDNIKGIKKSLSKFIKMHDADFDTEGVNYKEIDSSVSLDFSNTSNQEFNSDAILLDNESWLGQLKYMEFLQNFGSRISVNELLKRDAIKNRLDNHNSLSLLEMNYMVCQGYDFYHLNKHYDCVLQIGGSDQWSNIITGVDMIDKISKNQSFGLTTKLLLNSNGEKMGKTVNGAVWINEDMLSPYEYFQYFRNILDSDVIKIAGFYGEFNSHEMEELQKMILTDINHAKKHLAHRLTSICHGVEIADQVVKTAVSLFENKDSIQANSLENFYINREENSSGTFLTDFLVTNNLVKSKKLAKELITNGAIAINDKKVDDIHYLLDLGKCDKPEILDLSNKSEFEGLKLKLSLGKKKHFWIHFN